VRVLVAHEKHGARYFDASTTETWAAASLRLLRERFEEDWYQRPDDETNQEVVAMSEAEVAALPEALRVQATHLRRQATANRSRAQRDRDWYDKAKKLVDEVDISTVSRGRVPGEWEEPRAWAFLIARNEAEYERVELAEVEVVTLVDIGE
jgi:plasmid stabilization system protein ParE